MSPPLDLVSEIKWRNWGQFTWMCIEVGATLYMITRLTDQMCGSFQQNCGFSPSLPLYSPRHLLCAPRSHFQTSKKVTAKTQILFRGWQYIVWNRNPYFRSRHQQLWPRLWDNQLNNLEKQYIISPIQKYLTRVHGNYESMRLSKTINEEHYREETYLA